MGANLAAAALVLAVATAGGVEAPLPLSDVLAALARGAGAEVTFLGPTPSAPVLAPAGHDLDAVTGLLDRLGLSYAFSTDISGATRLVVVTAGFIPPSPATAPRPSPSGPALPPDFNRSPAEVLTDPSGDSAKLPPGFVASPELVLSEGGSDEGSGPEGFSWSPMQPLDGNGESQLPSGFVNTPAQPSGPPGQSSSTP